MQVLEDNRQCKSAIHEITSSIPRTAAPIIDENFLSVLYVLKDGVWWIGGGKHAENWENDK